MFILSLTIPRKETTDVSILFCSDDVRDLEELILSLWEEKWYISFLYTQDLKYSKQCADEYAKRLSITFAPLYK